MCSFNHTHPDWISATYLYQYIGMECVPPCSSFWAIFSLRLLMLAYQPIDLYKLFYIVFQFISALLNFSINIILNFYKKVKKFFIQSTLFLNLERIRTVNSQIFTLMRLPFRHKIKICCLCFYIPKTLRKRFLYMNYYLSLRASKN